MEEKYPLILERVQAIAIDTCLIIVLMFTFSVTLEFFDHVPNWIRTSLFLGLFIFYEPICTTFGATLGNYILDIRVRKNFNSGKQINLIQAFIRYFFKMLFGWLSFLSIFTNKKKRALHDLVSGTVMIKYKSGTVSVKPK